MQRPPVQGCGSPVTVSWSQHGRKEENTLMKPWPVFSQESSNTEIRPKKKKVWKDGEYLLINSSPEWFHIDQSEVCALLLLPTSALWDSFALIWAKISTCMCGNQSCRKNEQNDFKSHVSSSCKQLMKIQLEQAQARIRTDFLEQLVKSSRRTDSVYSWIQNSHCAVGTHSFAIVLLSTLTLLWANTHWLLAFSLFRMASPGSKPLRFKVRGKMRILLSVLKKP